MMSMSACSTLLILLVQDGHSEFSDLEAVRQRSIALDIPSAELLDSILEFANNVCGGNAEDILASMPLVSLMSTAPSYSQLPSSACLSQPTHACAPPCSQSHQARLVCLNSPMQAPLLTHSLTTLCFAVSTYPCKH